MANTYCIGVDIGGTTVKLGIFHVDGRLEDKWEIPTDHADGGAHILEEIARALQEYIFCKGLSKEDIKGIGIGVPGPVQPDGHVDLCVNLGWMNVYPAKVLSQLLGGGIECYVGNDANVAALGEMWQGGGKGYDSIVFVTLGTGVGGGIIVNNHIVSGSHGLGGEIGHIRIREDEAEMCNCGGTGCLEQVASATGIVRQAHRVLKKYTQESSMRAFGETLTCRHVCDCAKQGDELAIMTMDICMYYLGWALSILTQVCDPQVFVLGGGVSAAGEWLAKLVQKNYDRLTPMLHEKPKVVLASLGNDAGIYGAARLVLSESELLI